MYLKQIGVRCSVVVEAMNVYEWASIMCGLGWVIFCESSFILLFFNHQQV